MPEADYPTVDGIVFDDVSAARGVWGPMAGSPPVSVVRAGGRSALEMRCAFAGTKFERASWDGAVKLDLTACRGIAFRFFCPDLSPVGHFSIYFKSGDGWYTSGFAPDVKSGWSTIRIDKSRVQIEGSPAGWSRVETIRISAWRGGATDTVLYAADFGLLGTDAPIVIVRGDAAGGGDSGEARAVRQFAENVSRCLEELDVPYLVFSDRDVTAERLADRAVVVLPHNPVMPAPVADELAKYLRGGGKLVAFYHLPNALRPIVGIDGGRHVLQTHEGQFASIHVEQDVLPGAPAIVGQRSWNLGEAKPVAGRSRVAAVWHDAEGESTGQPAIVLSDNGAVMTHVLLRDDPANKRKLLLALIGHFAPEVWSQAVAGRIGRIGKLGPYRGFDEAERAIRRSASGVPAVLEIVEEVSSLRREAVRHHTQGELAAAMAVAEQAQAKMIDAYCRTRKPLPGEHRAFWCHSAFGVSGMTWDQAIKRLADNGFTAILPNMLWGGVAYYESDVLPVAPQVAEKGDQIAACVAACKKYGIECHVWKVNWNTGGHAPKSFIERIKREGRTQVLYNGKPQERWLCPSHPANRQLEIDAMVEVAAKYGVAGVHFDYIRYPHGDSCFCRGCRSRFEARIGSKVADWPTDLRENDELKGKWLDFRRDNITKVVASVAKRVRALEGDVEISAAVFRNWPTDRDTIGQDWKLWCDKGYLDFVCPMDYTASTAAFESYIRNQLEWTGKVDCYPGIGLTVWPDRTDVCKLIDQINVTRQYKTGGFTIFNYGPVEANDVLPQCGKGITRRR